MASVKEEHVFTVKAVNRPSAQKCNNIWGRTPPRLAKEKKALRFLKKLQILKYRYTYWGLDPGGAQLACIVT